jgi:hypothetical protein
MNPSDLAKALSQKLGRGNIRSKPFYEAWRNSKILYNATHDKPFTIRLAIAIYENQLNADADDDEVFILLIGAIACGMMNMNSM